MIDSTTASIVNELFAALIAINPAFKQAWPTEVELKATKRQWILAFQESNITSLEQVKKGMKMVRKQTSPFIPSPGAFINLCKATPEDAGAPNARQAYIEAVNKSGASYGQPGKPKTWTHELVGLAARTVGSFKVSRGLQNEVFPEFQEVYLQLCDEFVSGRNMNRIEEAKVESFSQLDIHWALTVQRHLDENTCLSNSIPDDGLRESAIDIHRRWASSKK